MASIKDVARHAGVSHATVSRVLTGVVPVRPDTAARVHEAIQTLDYHPNRLARGLRHGRTSTVGILVSAIGRPLYVELIRRIEARLREQGVVSFIVETARDPVVEREALKVLAEMRAIGAVLVGDRQRDAPSNHDVLAMQKLGVRVVTFSGRIPGSLIPCVRLDNCTAGLLATRHLVRLGHRRIAYLGAGLPESVSTAEYLANRRRGYEEALREADLAPSSDLIVSHVPRGPGETTAAIKQLLGMPNRPTAILASDDELAIETMGAVLGLGCSIPTNLSVMGFDDISLADRVWPPLTTIRQPLDLMVQKLVEILHTSTPSRNCLRLLEFPPELITRHSTGPAPPSPTPIS